MNRKIFALTGSFFLLVSCSSRPTITTTPSPVPIKLFALSQSCGGCHNGLKDEAGNDVSNYTQWGSTMMANAARDPYYQASVSAEIDHNPKYQTLIEEKCAPCHFPMASFTDAAAGKEVKIFGADGYLNPNQNLHALAMDGVSCSVCHQIQPANLGQPGSFSGGIVFDTQTSFGKRTIFGAFIPDPALASVMSSSSGFVPVQSAHLAKSELCATCHTLYTPYFKADGELASELFPEQTPYLEWKHSSISQTESCQTCHMPAAQGGVLLSTLSKMPQSPFPQHIFVGGNSYMSAMLKRFSDELQVTAPPAQLDSTNQRTLDQLQKKAATLSITNAKTEDGDLAIDILLQSLVGHKFPSGFPARRLWLHVEIQDHAGTIVFESGGYAQNGMINDNENDTNPISYEPHYNTINSPDQVQIYETILHTDSGNVTTTLLKTAGYLKDNRLLPTGFDKQTASPDIAVYGGALQDEDFTGGGDTVHYKITLGKPAGPYTVNVELLYQSIGYRWAQNLGSSDTLDTKRFLGYYDEIPNLPVVIDHQMITVQP